MGTKISTFIIFITATAFPLHTQAPSRQSVAFQIAASAGAVRLPFMAQYQVTQTRRLPDGSTVTNEISEVIAVDSLGRRMIAATKTPQSGDQPKTAIKVFDPVAHFKFSWMSPGNEATVSGIPIGGNYECSYMTFSIEGPTVKTKDEDLGTATVKGVEARGSRFTKTMTIGRHRKKLTVLNMVETWKAVDPELGGLLVRYVNDDHQSGARADLELVSFRQSEPDASVFRLPSGYRIVNREVSPPDCPSSGEIEPLPPPGW